MENKEQALIVAAHQTDTESLKLRIRHAPRSERYKMGKQLRKTCPRSSHAKWVTPVERQDSCMQAR